MATDPKDAEIKHLCKAVRDKSEYVKTLRHRVYEQAAEIERLQGICRGNAIRELELGEEIERLQAELDDAAEGATAAGAIIKARDAKIKRLEAEVKRL